MTKPLNISKSEAECLSRMVGAYMAMVISTSALTTSGDALKYVCMPLLTALKSKIDAMVYEPEKISQTKQATASTK